ncbi:MAG TPA: hypothetical protein VGD87_17845 [Archangium sp.]
MDACTCHLCGEAMEPDVVLAQGDTCELCFLLYYFPMDEAGVPLGIAGADVEEALQPL